MDHRRILAAWIVCAATAAGPASAADYGAGNARVRLVVGANQPTPEEPVLLGVHFDIKPGWHIYWKNPGGAGLSTEIDWRLPEGVEAGDLQWPLPIGFTQSGDIPGYGYEESVVLAARVHSESAVRGDAVVGASVSWLACKDVCVLGSAELESRWSDIEVEPAFATRDEELPESVDTSDPPFTVTVRRGTSAGAIGLWLQWQVAPQTVEWFPDPPDGLEVNNVTIQTRGGLTRVDADVRQMAGSKTGQETLDSVVVITDENNRRRGWILAVDLENPRNKGEKR
jgi:DsbC/DsbD-like thiol-disulfide interchange protein